MTYFRTDYFNEGRSVTTARSCYLLTAGQYSDLRRRRHTKQTRTRSVALILSWPVSFEACFGEALGLFGKDTKLHLHKFSLNSNNILEILSLAQHEIPCGGNVLLRVAQLALFRACSSTCYINRCREGRSDRRPRPREALSSSHATIPNQLPQSLDP
jgi:hypothetical protein